MILKMNLFKKSNNFQIFSRPAKGFGALLPVESKKVAGLSTCHGRMELHVDGTAGADTAVAFLGIP